MEFAPSLTDSGSSLEWPFPESLEQKGFESRRIRVETKPQLEWRNLNGDLHLFLRLVRCERIQIIHLIDSHVKPTRNARFRYLQRFPVRLLKRVTMNTRRQDPEWLPFLWMKKPFVVNVVVQERRWMRRRWTEKVWKHTRRSTDSGSQMNMQVMFKLKNLSNQTSVEHLIELYNRLIQFVNSDDLWRFLVPDLITFRPGSID